MATQIIKGHVSRDHVPVMMSVPPYVASNRVVACSHPHYDWTGDFGARFDWEVIPAMWTDLFPRLKRGLKVILFASECCARLTAGRDFRDIGLSMVGRGKSVGRTEIAMEELLDAASELEERACLVLRIHSKNSASDYETYLAEFDFASERGLSLPIACVSDLVVGITSMLLVEASRLGKKATLSTLAYENEQNWLHSAWLSVGAVANRGNLRRILPRLVYDAPVRQVSSAWDSVPEGATTRALDGIEGIVRGYFSAEKRAAKL